MTKRGSNFKTVIQDALEAARNNEVNLSAETMTPEMEQAFDAWLYRLPDDLAEKIGGLNTWKLRLFCYYYSVHLNSTVSALKAGYSPATASQKGYDLKKHTLKDIMPALIAWSRNPTVTRAELVDALMSIYEKAMYPGEDGNGKQGKPDLSVAQRALSEIAKLSGFDKQAPEKPEDRLNDDLEFAFGNKN